MKEVIDLLRNIKGSPKTTSAGVVLVIVALYIMYSAETITYVSVETGMLAVGLFLFILPDSKNIDYE